MTLYSLKWSYSEQNLKDWRLLNLRQNRNNYLDPMRNLIT